MPRGRDAGRARRRDGTPGGFFAQSAQPLFLWLRWMVGNSLLELHRYHVGAQMRNPRREVSDGRRLGGAAARADGDDDDNTRVALVARLTAGGHRAGDGRGAGRAPT